LSSLYENHRSLIRSFRFLLDFHYILQFHIQFRNPHSISQSTFNFAIHTQFLQKMEANDILVRTYRKYEGECQEDARDTAAKDSTDALLTRILERRTFISMKLSSVERKSFMVRIKRTIILVVDSMNIARSKNDMIVTKLVCLELDSICFRETNQSIFFRRFDLNNELCSIRSVYGVLDGLRRSLINVGERTEGFVDERCLRKKVSYFNYIVEEYGLTSDVKRVEPIGGMV